MEDRPDITIELIADHTLHRLAMKPARFELPKLASRETLREVVRRILDLSADRKTVLDWLTDTLEVPINQSSFYRFVTAVDKAAAEVHRDMLGGIAGTPLTTFRNAGLRLGISPVTVEQLVDAGKLEAVDVAGELRISQAAIRDFIRSRTFKRTKRKAKTAPRSAPSADSAPAITA